MSEKTNKKRLIVFFVTVAAIAVLIATTAKGIANNLSLGLDLQGGFEILYEVSPLNNDGSLPDMSAVSSSVSKRVDVLGVTEPQIIIEGDNRIRVQLQRIQFLIVHIHGNQCQEICHGSFVILFRFLFLSGTVLSNDERRLHLTRI
ncbi:MAG: hypothetical protein HUJ57_08640 [Erysipelotrichaceae bacterium]|nr:hypothetical protein [Erysipelotrichaceae bacterium]